MKYREADKLRKALKLFDAEIPKMTQSMVNIAHVHFTKSFSNQGFTDKTLEKWKPRKRQRYRTKSGSVVDDTTRGILIGKGTANLRKLYKRVTSKYSGEITDNPITKKYSRVHNEGLRAGRGKGFMMPKRQFVGYSHVMDSNIKRMINTKIRKSFAQ